MLIAAYHDRMPLALADDRVDALARPLAERQCRRVKELAAIDPEAAAA